MSKEIDDIVRKQVEERLVRYYQMNELEKAQYRRKILRAIEAGKEASAKIHTEALMKRCRGLDD